MSDLVFYTNPMSRGRIVRWMLEEIGQPYETRILRWETGDTKAADYLAFNPMGKVPAIVHDGVVDASPKLQFSAFVDAAPVTGPVDAHSVAQARESCRSAIRVAVVSVGKITRDNLNLADLSVGERHAVHIDDLYVLAVASTSGRYHSDG